MKSRALLDELQKLSHVFSREAAARKLELLEALETQRLSSARSLEKLQSLLCFIRAYPDSRAVLARAAALAEALRGDVEQFIEQFIEQGGDEPLQNTGLPGAAQHHAYSYQVLQDLIRIAPGCLEVDWDEFEREGALLDALVFTVSLSEVQGLEDIDINFVDWLEQSRPDAEQTDLEFLLALFARSGLPAREQAHLFEVCEVPVRYQLAPPGTGRCEVHTAVERVTYQRQDVPREKFDLRPRIRRAMAVPSPLLQRKGQELIDLSQRALCCRNLEIYPLIHANAADVRRLSFSHGFEVLLIGVRPESRNALEALYFFLIMKNGIPIAYGPASVLLGCCEMGINLFPEFRGGEIRTICSHLMRTLYHAAHVRYFFLTSYAMGEGNDDALRSGAFWFYRKLGFLPTNPAVEELARQEEARMRQEPDVRSGLAMLRRLTHTSAYLDMSGGQCCPIELGRLGIQVSRHVARKHGGDRKQALTASVRQVRRALGIGSLEGWSRDSRQALESLSPILTQIEDLGQWSKRDRQALAAIIQAKAAPTETAYLERSFRHPRLASALNQIAHAD